ncbi:MAG TPA: N-acetyltransferase [Methylophaga sp.]|nr:MAG: GNAT family N-acetyltransferase [Gammaproteobacteria bacterium]HHA19082.1 N-acetyltransferase [Methylophaga sp.]
MGEITAPEPLQTYHKIEHFDCGNHVLNRWLLQKALKNERTGGSRTYVVCCEDKVIAYYAIATGSIEHAGLPSKLRRNMPDPIPVLILGRLAVDSNWQDQHIGRGLLKDAVIRSCLIAKQVGVSALFVHCISDEAKQYYLKYGFVESRIDPMTVLLRLKDALQYF